jgi:hypothetical protein
VWGIAVLSPLYFLFDRIGALYSPAMTHPDFYYGFIGVALAWQAAFLLIGSDPARFRPMMIAAIAEKFVYVISLVALFEQGRLRGGQAAVAIPDFLLGILFIIAFFKTGHAAVDSS